MTIIWKIRLEVKTLQQIELPAGAQILSAQAQGKDLCVWALVEPMAPKVCRSIEVYGTGHRIPSRARRHLGTALMSEGALVWHVFEVL